MEISSTLLRAPCLPSIRPKLPPTRLQGRTLNLIRTNWHTYDTHTTYIRTCSNKRPGCTFYFSDLNCAEVTNLLQSSVTCDDAFTASSTFHLPYIHTSSPAHSRLSNSDPWYANSDATQAWVQVTFPRYFLCFFLRFCDLIGLGFQVEFSYSSNMSDFKMGGKIRNLETR